MPAPRWPRIHPLGDAALLVELGRRVDTALNTRALALAAALAKRRDVREAVPGYASVAVHYDPEQVTRRGLATAIQRLVEAKPPPAPHGGGGPWAGPPGGGFSPPRPPPPCLLRTGDRVKFFAAGSAAPEP